MITRIKELVGLAMIGDGLLGVIDTRRHMKLWQIGPAPVREGMKYFTDRPAATRALSALEVAVGLWLASEQTPSKAKRE